MYWAVLTSYFESLPEKLAFYSLGTSYEIDLHQISVEVGISVWPKCSSCFSF